MIEVFGYVAAVVMGITLGIIGGGGSILTVPILVYLFDIHPVQATAYSLFVVGVSSAIGSIQHFKNGNVQINTAIVFGLPSILAVYLVRKWLVPIIPDPVFSSEVFLLSKGLFFMGIFSILMIVAAFAMIKPTKVQPVEKPISKTKKWMLLVGEGLLVGGLTGLVGAGGGFLIIPALVLLAKLNMKQAVGTSLVIISLKSLIGFTGDLSSNHQIDFSFLLYFSAFAIVGILIGAALSSKVSEHKLKPAFGWFVLVMGCYILMKELVFS